MTLFRGSNAVTIVDATGTPITYPVTTPVSLPPDTFAVASATATGAFVSNPMFTIDTTGMVGVIVNFVSVGSGNSIVCGFSLDNLNYFPVGAIPSDSTNGGIAATRALTSVISYKYPKTGRYFQCYVSTYGSGTVTAQVSAIMSPVLMTANQTNVVGNQNEGNAAGASGLLLAVGGQYRAGQFSVGTTEKYTMQSLTQTGAAILQPYADPGQNWSYASPTSGLTNTTTPVTLVAAAGANVRNYLTSMDLSSSALGTGGEYYIRDGAAGNFLWRGFIGTAVMPPTRLNFPTPLQGSANTLMEFGAVTASVTGAVYVNAQGYQAP